MAAAAFPGGDGAVEGIFGAADQRLCVGSIGIAAAARRIKELFLQERSGADGGFQKGGVPGDGVEFQERPGIKCVVVQGPAMGGVPIPPPGEQPAAGAGQRAGNHCLRPPGRRQVAGFGEHGACAGHGRDHQAVPGCQHFIVRVEPGPDGTDPGQSPAERFDGGRPLLPVPVMQKIGDAASPEISGGGDAVPAAEARRILRTQQLLHLFRRPDIVLAFDAVAVRRPARRKNRRWAPSVPAERNPAFRGQRQHRLRGPSTGRLPGMRTTAMHCHTAFFQSAESASLHRWNSGRSRRRHGRTIRRDTWRPGCAEPWPCSCPASPDGRSAAGTVGCADWGIWALFQIRRAAGRRRRQIDRQPARRALGRRRPPPQRPGAAAVLSGHRPQSAERRDPAAERRSACSRSRSSCGFGR